MIWKAEEIVVEAALIALTCSRAVIVPIFR